MDVLHNLLHGFSIGFQPTNILFCLIGVFLGTVIGVLPGIGPIGAISVLLPATFRMEPTPAIIMLAGIYYGAMYGGSTTAILVNIPGEAASVVTCLDGHQMAKQGKAGPALGIAAFGSFIAGTLGVIGLMFFATPLSEFGLKFGPPEYFGIMLLGLTLVASFSRGSIIKTLIMAVLGIILSCVGIDYIHGTPRMIFGLNYLWDGINLVPLAVGLFGISEILINLEATVPTEILKTKIKNLFPSITDWAKSKGPIIRGAILGFFVGILPGIGAIFSTFASYAIEKKLSKEPEKFGKGAIEGVAGPETANNAASAGAFIPLLTLGIPPNIIMALLFGALIVHGVEPGPFLIKNHPDLFWGLVSSMYIGNVMLLIINLPLIPIWVQVLKVPYRILFPLILLFCIVGTYSINNSFFDVLLMIFFGIFGYLARKLEYEPAPLIFAFVLGPLIEVNLKQSLILSRGSFTIFFTSPIAAVSIIVAIIVLFISFIPYFTRTRKKFEE